MYILLINRIGIDRICFKTNTLEIGIPKQNEQSLKEGLEMVVGIDF